MLIERNRFTLTFTLITLIHPPPSPSSTHHPPPPAPSLTTCHRVAASLYTIKVSAIRLASVTLAIIKQLDQRWH